MQQHAGFSQLKKHDRTLREEVMLPAGYDPARQLGGP